MSVLSMACANWEDWRLFMCEACNVFGNCGTVDSYQSTQSDVLSFVVVLPRNDGVV